MNLTILPNIVTYNNRQSSNNIIRQSNNNRLAANSVNVSFGTRAVKTIGDVFEAQMEADIPRLSRIATTFLDVLESVAFKLKDSGFSFDRAYCELNPVKSAKSSKSKIVRSSSFKVPDQIRATMYCNNPYDLNKLNMLLLEMKKRGYVLADVEMPIEEMRKRAYPLNEADAQNAMKVFKIPDLDIRLEDAAENRHLLPNELRYSIGKPQKSGYEDIQMRFVREFDKKKSPVMHELLVLFGPNYSLAKHIESDKVYGNLRKFNELRIDLDEASATSSHAQKAKRYIDLIQQLFRGKVSQKLFLNAKNKDLYDITEEIPISFSPTDVQVFDSYFAGFNDRMSSSYKELKDAAKVSSSAVKQLNVDLRHDRGLMKTIHDNLKGTIEYFNNKSDLNLHKEK